MSGLLNQMLLQSDLDLQVPLADFAVRNGCCDLQIEMLT